MKTKNRAYTLPILAIGVAIGLTISGGAVAAQVASTTSTTTATTSWPTCNLSASNYSITPGESATLNWTSTGATSLMFDHGLGGATAESGSLVVFPTTDTTYTASFDGALGSTTCTVTISVENDAHANTATSTTATTSDTTTTINTNSATTSGSTKPVTIWTAENILPPATLPTTPTVGTSTSPFTILPALVTALTTNANTTGTVGVTTAAPKAYPAAGTTPAPMVVDVHTSGTALIRGEVVTAGASSIVIHSWGGTWAIRTTGATSVAGGGSDFSGVSVGDFVGVQGTVATDQMYTIDATLVRNWTTNPYVAPAETSADADTSASGTTSGATTGSVWATEPTTEESADDTATDETAVEDEQ